jgi:hypothetical protein
MKHRIVIILVVFLAGCDSGSRGAPAPAVTWRAVGSWSGRGSQQLETFAIETGEWRARWETSNERPAGAGHFKATAHSGDSGRVIAEIADQKGAGRGIVTVTEAPRRYYMTVDSANVEWSITVEELRASGPGVNR